MGIVGLCESLKCERLFETSVANVRCKMLPYNFENSKFNPSVIVG